MYNERVREKKTGSFDVHSLAHAASLSINGLCEHSRVSALRNFPTDGTMLRFCVCVRVRDRTSATPASNWRDNRSSPIRLLSCARRRCGGDKLSASVGQTTPVIYLSRMRNMKGKRGRAKSACPLDCNESKSAWSASFQGVCVCVSCVRLLARCQSMCVVVNS